MFIELTSFVQNKDYSEKSGLIVRDQWVETKCVVNSEEILFIMPTAGSEVGSSLIKFKNGSMLTFKETVKEIKDLIN